MDQKKPSIEDIQRAFSVTHLEPDISEDTLFAYAAGRATNVETDLVETMLSVDPSLNEAISAIREELALVKEPLPAVARAEPKAKKAGWLPTWLSTAGTVFAFGACGLLALVFIDSGRQQRELLIKNKQVAVALEGSRNKVQLLQQEIASMDRKLKLAGSNKAQVLAQLEKTQKQINQEIADQAKLISTPTGIESLVGHAIEKGFSLPPSLAAVETLRGPPADLIVTMSPSQTSVRMPVKLSWSGAASGGFNVELLQDGDRIWSGRVDQPQAMPPAGTLKPGAVYAWQILAGSKRSPMASFRICTESESKRASEIDKDRTLGPLEKGVVYAAMGLVSDAEAQFKLLRNSDPALANRLTKQLEQLRK